MNLSWSLYTLLIYAGKLPFIHKYPSAAPYISLPFSSNITKFVPKYGFPTNPGLNWLAPARGVMAKLPVSV